MRYPPILGFACLCALTYGSVQAAEQPEVDNSALPGNTSTASSQSASQAQQPESYWEDLAQRETLLGDMWGLRPAMADYGLDVNVSFAMNVAGNPVGGDNQGTTQVNSTGVNIGADLGTLLGLDGLTFFTSAVYRSGTSLSERHIHNVISVQQLYGNQTYRLMNLSLKQSLFDDQLSIKAGRIAQFDDFALSPSFGYYMNNAFDGNPKGFFLMGPFNSYPVATWGAVVRGGAAIGDQDGFYGVLGAYGSDSDLGNEDNHGTNFSFNFDQGANIMAEIGYKRDWTPDTTGNPGKYVVGGWMFTGPFDNNVGGGTSNNVGGFYYLIEQNLMREGNPMMEPNSTRLADEQAWGTNQDFLEVVQGLYFWTSGQFNMSDEVFQSDYFVSGGLYYRGLIPGRDQDILSFGAAWLNFSGSYAQSQQLVGQGDPDYEVELELSYRYQVTEYFYLQPNIQGVINPGGTGDIDDALVLGLQLQVDF